MDVAISAGAAIDLMRLVFSLCALFCLATQGCATEADPPSGALGSSITVTFKEMGIPVDAPFTRFSANIDFENSKPTSGSIQFTIDISSLDLGNPEYTKAVLKPEWFDGAQYPTATFVSTGVKMISSTELEASGKITIKGQTQEITFPVKIQRVGKQTNYEAVVHIDRTVFGVGKTETLSSELVADDVVIRVHASQTGAIVQMEGNGQ